MIPVRLILPVVATSFLGLFSGSMFLIGAALVPFWGALDPVHYRASFQAMGPYLGELMVPLMLMTIGFTFLTLITTRGSKLPWIIAFLGVFLVIPLYAMVHAPVNAKLFSGEALPSEWISALRDRWFFWHWVRTIAGTVGLVAAITAIINHPTERSK